MVTLESNHPNLARTFLAWQAMGKRKVKRQAAKKVKDKLDTQFNCVFCNHENSIECKMDQTNKVGHLNCKICAVTWQCTITYLDEPIDVYSGWIDACEDVNQREKAAKKKDREQRLAGGARSDGEAPPRPTRTAAAEDSDDDPFEDDD